ncbi:hypothetical protein VTJ04DRAFT_2433 [Mycothermus thermophilus]|uniref:uncharacterized protein n=1 Tax=Humicola insolens TaxID=85995 RepID=UPI003743B13F
MLQTPLRSLVSDGIAHHVPRQRYTHPGEQRLLDSSVCLSVPSLPSHICLRRAIFLNPFPPKIPIPSFPQLPT